MAECFFFVNADTREPETVIHIIKEVQEEDILDNTFSLYVHFCGEKTSELSPPHEITSFEEMEKKGFLFCPDCLELFLKVHNAQEEEG